MSNQILIVVSKFNEFITKQLHSGAIEYLEEAGINSSNIQSLKVPGCFELPTVAGAAARSQRYKAIICLGAVIRGDTPHFDYVCNETASGIMRAGYETGVPVVFGVITTDTIEQALSRSGIKGGNKGKEAAATALEMINVMRTIEEGPGNLE